jgi:hypothetical protein
MIQSSQSELSEDREHDESGGQPAERGEFGAPQQTAEQTESRSGRAA